MTFIITIDKEKSDWPQDWCDVMATIQEALRYSGLKANVQIVSEEDL